MDKALECAVEGGAPISFMDRFRRRDWRKDVENLSAFEKMEAEIKKGNSEGWLSDRLDKIIAAHPQEAVDALKCLLLDRVFRYGELKLKHEQMSLLLIEMLKDEQGLNGFPGYRNRFAEFQEPDKP